MTWQDSWAEAIRNIESGSRAGRYDLRGPEIRNPRSRYYGQRALGAYQVMPGNLAPWLSEAGMPGMSEDQFLASPQAQDQLFRHRFGRDAQRYGNPDDAASIWFTGRPLAQGRNASDSMTTGQQYVDRFRAGIGAGAQQPANGGRSMASWLDWLIPQAQAATSGAYAPRRPIGDVFAGDWSLGGALPTDTPAPSPPIAAPLGPPANVVRGPRTPFGYQPPTPAFTGRSGGLNRALATSMAAPTAPTAPTAPAQFGGIGGIGSDVTAGLRAPAQFGSEVNIDVPFPMPPDPNAIMEGARAAQPPPPRGLGDMFMGGLRSDLTRQGLSMLAGQPLNYRTTEEQTLLERQAQQRTNMDRIWAQAFPNGQPNMQHPLLAGQPPQVAAMLAGMGPEQALPLLAKSAMERRQLEFKTAGDQAFIFDPRTGQTMAVPGSQPKPPTGFQWAANGQLEPIPGGPGEHITSEVAGRLAIMRTAKPHISAARSFFTRQWGAGETARNAFGGAVLAPEYDRHRRTIRLAVEGSLRAMTGAAAPQQEVEQYMEMFMPKVSDPPQIARQKIDMLERFMDNAEEIVTRGRRPAGGQQPQQPTANDPLGIR